MVCQMIQQMSSLGGFAVPMTLVAVKMAMSDGMVLECTIRQRANHSEALLSSLFCLQFVLFRPAFLTLLLSLDLSHF